MSKPSRWHNGAESREMGRVEGWVVVRRKGAAPYLIHEKEWDALPSAEDGQRWADEYDRASSAIRARSAP